MDGCENCGCHWMQNCDCPSDSPTTIVRLEREVAELKRAHADAVKANGQLMLYHQHNESEEIVRLKSKLARQQEAHMKALADDEEANAFAYNELDKAYTDLEKECARYKALWELEAIRCQNAEEEGFWDRVRMVRAELALKELRFSHDTDISWAGVLRQNKIIDEVLARAKSIENGHTQIVEADIIEECVAHVQKVSNKLDED